MAAILWLIAGVNLGLYGPDLFHGVVDWFHIGSWFFPLTLGLFVD